MIVKSFYNHKLDVLIIEQKAMESETFDATNKIMIETSPRTITYTLSKASTYRGNNHFLDDSDVPPKIIKLIYSVIADGFSHCTKV